MILIENFPVLLFCMFVITLLFSAVGSFYEGYLRDEKTTKVVKIRKWYRK
jgi:hypothetical protein